MRGKEFKQLLKLNGLRQEDAAKIFNVSRQTVSIWCKSETIDDKIVKLILENFRVTDPTTPIITVTGSGNANIVGNNNTGNIDNRQYYSDSPDVLRAQIEVLDERIKEKDAQIKEKDAQIKELHALLNEMIKKH